MESKSSDPDYLIKRLHNNEAVKRCRAKKKAKLQALLKRINDLEAENETLKHRCDLLRAQYSVLNELATHSL